MSNVQLKKINLQLSILYEEQQSLEYKLSELDNQIGQALYMLNSDYLGTNYELITFSKDANGSNVFFNGESSDFDNWRLDSQFKLKNVGVMLRRARAWRKQAKKMIAELDQNIDLKEHEKEMFDDLAASEAEDMADIESLMSRINNLKNSL